MEVAPGVHRIESVLGPRTFSQYLLLGERALLVDTGVAETPEKVILPYLESVGLSARDLDFALVTHADVDHFGGNGALRGAAREAVLCAHAADAPWVEDRERILRERYGWYAGEGVDYPPDVREWLRESLGPDVPLDLHLSGGEVFRLGPGLLVEVLHLPGHSPGHVGLWEPSSRSAIITDAALGGGLLDMEGNVISPPPYFDARAYEESVRRLQGLSPRLLLTAHYPVMEGEEAARFLEESLEFVRRARRVVAEALEERGELDLRNLLELAGPRLGPFTAMENELAGTLRAHLRELVAAGRAREAPGGGGTVWRSLG
ncbi:beta-lactamase-like protein [Rubrobacter xylanophilus DSM 9941]|uniref:Beta-lactamase-like protein n=1 Tax=Rubrobacter xylanophilus (strain DSM 9941 / JCM 11954 / NBRC 16129 / PRD-1) TaxID=266117 RepID=Q1AYM6_RUBXD|nr:MBL fold metallo-hydrolase [Rubrobacter xylanophilus]ABG03502.1 beta-lactamase-like protein [Rubrobacter xylanophilus DSM 9941]